MSPFKTFAIAAASAAVLAGAPAMAQGPQDARGRGPAASFDLMTINNARVNTAQQTLGAQGFFKARSMQVNGRQYDLWYNSGFRNSCVGFTSMNGWVRDARDFRDAECGFGNGSGGGGGWGNGPGGGGGFNTRSLEGLRVDSAKATLRDRGFNFVRASRIDGQQYDMWSSGRTCVGFASYNGRVTNARSFRDDDCGAYGGGQGGGWGRFNARDLEGLSVDSAKDMLRRQDFSFARSTRFDNRQYDLWYSGRSRSGCVGFTSYNGRVTNARSFDERECDYY